MRLSCRNEFQFNWFWQLLKINISKDLTQSRWTNCFLLCFPWHMSCTWCIGVYHTGIYCPEQNIWKIDKHSFKNKKSLSSVSHLEVFYKDLVDISYDYELREDSIWLQLIYYLTSLAYRLVKRFVKHYKLTTSKCWRIYSLLLLSLKSVINEKFSPMRKLVLIVYNWLMKSSIKSPRHW